MAFDNQDFITKLRQNNVFPQQGKGNPNPLIGMPDFFSGRRPEQAQAPVQLQSQPAPVEEKYDPSAGHIMAPSGMASAWIPGAADINAGKIVQGTTPNEVQQRQMELQGPKNAIQYGNLAINKQKADILGYKAKNPNMVFKSPLGGNITAFDPATGKSFDTGVDAGSLTEEEKLNLLGSQKLDQIGAQGANQKEIQGMRNEGQLKNIAAQAVAKNQNGMSPSQFNAQETGKLREIMLTRPELSRYIIKDPNSGQLTVDQNAPLGVVSELKSVLYNKATAAAGDVDLDAEPVSKPARATPTSKTPTANMSLPSAQDLIKKYSK